MAGCTLGQLQASAHSGVCSSLHILVYVLFQCDPVAGGPQLSSGGAGCGQSEAAGRGESICRALPVRPGTDISPALRMLSTNHTTPWPFLCSVSPFYSTWKLCLGLSKIKVFIFSSFVAEEADEGKCSL